MECSLIDCLGYWSLNLVRVEDRLLVVARGGFCTSFSFQLTFFLEFFLLEAEVLQDSVFFEL